MKKSIPLLVFAIILSVSGIIIYKTFSNGDIRLPSENADQIKNPNATSKISAKKHEIKFVPADFDLNMDEDNVLVILNNPETHRKEFNDLVYNLNMKVLNHVSNRLDLSTGMKKQVEREYANHHQYLKRMYFDDFAALKDTTSNLYKIWYNNQSKSAVKLFDEVASKYTCYLVNLIFTTVGKQGDFDVLKRNKNMETPCGIAIKEAMHPMIERLESRAAIADFSASKGLLERKVEKAIAELAVMEVRDKKAIEKKLASKFFGLNVSTTNVEISAISVLKVGYKLDRAFQVSLDNRRKEVVVTLPQPQILSHEVYPKVDKLDIGWLKNIQKTDFNSYMDNLREAFRQEALNSDIMTKSENQVNELMSIMLGPVVQGLGNKYRIVIKHAKQSDPDLARLKK